MDVGACGVHVVGKGEGGIRLDPEHGTGPVLQVHFERGQAILQRVGCLPTFCMQEVAIGTFALAKAMYGSPVRSLLRIAINEHMIVGHIPLFHNTMFRNEHGQAHFLKKLLTEGLHTFWCSDKDPWKLGYFPPTFHDAYLNRHAALSTALSCDSQMQWVFFMHSSCFTKHRRQMRKLEKTQQVRELVQRLQQEGCGLIWTDGSSDRPQLGGRWWGGFGALFPDHTECNISEFVPALEAQTIGGAEVQTVPRGPILVGTRPQRGGGGRAPPPLYGPQNCRTEQCALSAPEAPQILF